MHRKTTRRGILTTREQVVPPDVTNAEEFYYAKQIEAGSELVVVTLGGDVRGRLTWFDDDAIALELRSGGERVIPKSDIKYLYKYEPPSRARGRRRDGDR